MKKETWIVVTLMVVLIAAIAICACMGAENKSKEVLVDHAFLKEGEQYTINGEEGYSFVLIDATERNYARSASVLMGVYKKGQFTGRFFMECESPCSLIIGNTRIETTYPKIGDSSAVFNIYQIVS